MGKTIAIDRLGRLVIPKDVRERHHLRQGSRLRVVERADAIILEPVPESLPLIERSGYLVIGGDLTGQVEDHRTVREDRIQRLTGSLR